MKKIILLFLLFISFTSQINAQNIIIPTPVDYKSVEESFTFDTAIDLVSNIKTSKTTPAILQFEDFLSKNDISFNKKQNVNNKNKTIVISYFENQKTILGDEGYELDITENTILLTANKSAGIFNGIQTLKQLILLNTKETITISGCKIVDYPRFGWRGLMLDVSRHFFSVEDVKLYLDQMSQYKLNVFHWHLTDDQGWRIEIKSLPKLTEIGAWRVERHGRFGKDRTPPQEGEKATYGGFYTQEQIKDIVKYAADRNITIVPEIDIPGHSMAALAAYPEFSTKKEPKNVAPGSKFSEWYGDGKFEMFIENTLDPTNEKVYEFIDKIFTEVAELFPGKYIHMGGDEAYHGFWDRDLSVQKFMKENTIKNSHYLQSYFVQRVEKIISSKGKQTIGWDEILEGGLADGAAVMSWRGMKGGIEAAKMGHKVVMSPTTYAYLDYTQGDESVENKIYASLSLEKSYSFEPVPKGVDAKYILGGQGNLWTEVVPNIQYAFYMTYPRAFSIAETMWSPSENKNWTSFVTRTEAHFSKFDTKEISISKAVFDPTVIMFKENGKLMCRLENTIPNSEIYYTIDNTYPVKFGIKYTIPFEVPAGDLNLRTQTFRNNNPLGRQLLIHRTDLEKRVGKKVWSYFDQE